MTIESFTYYIKARFSWFLNDLMQFIDPLPKMKKKETSAEYVFRIEKKYALRYMNHILNIIPDLDPSEIERDLIFVKDEALRKDLERKQHMLEGRALIKMLKAQLLEN